MASFGCYLVAQIATVYYWLAALLVFGSTTKLTAAKLPNRKPSKQNKANERIIGTSFNYCCQRMLLLTCIMIQRAVNLSQNSNRAVGPIWGLGFGLFVIWFSLLVLLVVAKLVAVWSFQVELFGF